MNPPNVAFVDRVGRHLNNVSIPGSVLGNGNLAKGGIDTVHVW
jgi:hypothetical protein